MEQAAWTTVNGYASLVCNALPELSSKAQRRVLVTPYFRAFLRGYGSAVAETIRTLRAKAVKAEDPELSRILTADHGRIDEAFSRSGGAERPTPPLHDHSLMPSRRPDGQIPPGMTTLRNREGFPQPSGALPARGRNGGGRGDLGRQRGARSALDRPGEHLRWHAVHCLPDAGGRE
jgi:hypothetical protein